MAQPFISWTKKARPIIGGGVVSRKDFLKSITPPIVLELYRWLR